MADQKKIQGPDIAALSNKIEVAEACGGVVTIRIEEANLLKAAVAGSAVLADALEEFLWDATPNLDSIEEACAEFQRDTGFLAPGKNEAASVNSGVTIEQRRIAWNEWARKKMDARNARARSALRSIGRSTRG